MSFVFAVGHQRGHLAPGQRLTASQSQQLDHHRTPQHLGSGEAAWDEAPEGAEYVMPEEYRRRAHGPAGWKNANLRTTFQKIVRRAGLEPWTRLWHSMRASCETDLARQFPLAVVAKWLGNTQAVAMRHYVDVTDADFERAIIVDAQPAQEAAQNAAQHAHAMDRSEPQPTKAAQEKTPVLLGAASSCETLQNRGMEAAGIEPAGPISQLPSSSTFMEHAAGRGSERGGKVSLLSV